MDLDKIINTYLKGWELGDGSMSLEATASTFFYDDPNTGRIFKDNFVEFVNDFKQAAVDMGAAANSTPFLEYQDIIINTETQPATAWCWWQAKGTTLQGSALIKFDSNGVLNEKIAYFSRLPDE